MPPDAIITSDSDQESIISILERPKVCGRQISSNKYFCSISGCQQSFKRLVHLDRHEYRHTGIRKHACMYDGCNKSYIIITHLKRHLKTTHELIERPPKSVKCEIEECSIMFRSVESMNRHVRESHENRKVYHCAHCEEKFTHRNKMKRHEISKHNTGYPFNCVKCTKGFYTEWHRQIHDCKVYNCAYCQKKFTKWTELLKHRRNSSKCKTSHKCEKCSKTFNRPSLLKSHIQSKHMGDNQELKFVCEHEGCEREYAYEKNLKHHIKIAHTGLSFNCTVENCDQLFKSNQNRLKHIVRDHNGKKNALVKPSSPNRQKKVRRRRKDAGKRTRSIIPIMTGIVVDWETEKLILNRNNGNIELEFGSESELSDTNKTKKCDVEKEQIENKEDTA